ncbi:MAG: peptidylprolyl isomerase [Verrucomicrobia bacterium]|nr:peptidylprolyl isomerase [Verrucomicrobiota bacterium]
MSRFRYLAIALLITSCSRESKTVDSQQTTPPGAPGTLDRLPAIQAETDPGAVLATVGDKTLTSRDAESEVGIRFESFRSQIPPGQENAIRSRIMGTVIEQFVVRTLLLSEADRQGITITAEDEATAFAKIDESLRKEGRSLEMALKTSPMGEERLREEVRVGIRIEKLLASDVLSKRPEPTDEEVEVFIEENRERLSVPEMVQASHILVTVDATDDDETRAAKKKKIEELRQELVDGADFAEVAMANSDCPSSQRGGDLGSFPRGRMVPAFEEAAFSQPTGEVGPIVETRFGYHIIKVQEHSDAGDVERDEVVTLMQQQNQSMDLKAYVESLMAEADISYAPSVKAFLPPTLQP